MESRAENRFEFVLRRRNTQPHASEGAFPDLRAAKGVEQWEGGDEAAQNACRHGHVLCPLAQPDRLRGEF